MSTTRDTFSTFDTTNSGDYFLDKAIIGSRTTSDFSETCDLSFDVNSDSETKIYDTSVDNDINMSSGFSSKTLEQSVILAGSHKQNLTSLFSDDFKDSRAVSKSLTSPFKSGVEYKINSPTLKKVHNEPGTCKSVMSTPCMHTLHTETLSSNSTVQTPHKVIPRIVVTSPTPPKSSKKFIFPISRNIISPVGQYVKGNGSVQGRKIIFRKP